MLGSTQADGVVDRRQAAAAGVDVVRRHSGGGAVLLRPGEVVWVDVLVPAGDQLWSDDVARAFAWLGTVWADALADVGLDASLHAGPTVATSWSDLVCFAGLGPGEVTVDGAKVVGMSQRRRRGGALFQCAALLAWEPADLLALLALDDGRRRQAAQELRRVAAGAGLDARLLEDALLARLAER